MRNRLLGLIPENHQGGFIIRTQAEAATDEELLADVDYLHKKWQNVLADSQAISAKSLIHQDLSLPLRVLRDFERDDISSIAVGFARDFCQNAGVCHALRGLCIEQVAALRR